MEAKNIHDLFKEVSLLHQGLGMDLVLTRQKLMPLQDDGYVHKNRQEKKEIESYEERTKKVKPKT